MNGIQILIVASACMLSVCLYAITGEPISIEFHIGDICPIARILVSNLLKQNIFLTKIVEKNESRFTRPVQEVFIHFEYRANRSPGLDVTWQSLRGDLTVHPWSPYRGACKSAVRHRRLRLCTV